MRLESDSQVPRDKVSEIRAKPDVTYYRGSSVFVEQLQNRQTGK
jgi:hypothetical protein